jgi:hypothetical protein
MAHAMMDQKGNVAAIPLLKRAIELDPNYAMAYACSVGKLFQSCSTCVAVGIRHQGLPAARPRQRKRKAGDQRKLF